PWIVYVPRRPTSDSSPSVALLSVSAAAGAVRAGSRTGSDDVSGATTVCGCGLDGVHPDSGAAEIQTATRLRSALTLLMTRFLSPVRPPTEQRLRADQAKAWI